MITVSFTHTIQRHVECPPTAVVARTVREALEAIFARNARARAYVLDDQGALRTHMVVFVNGKQIRDRSGLTDEVLDGGEVYVMQALSGG